MAQWWRDAVCYEIYVRSFADSNGDGIGDLAGIRGRLGHLAELGVDALWLTPFYPSPMADAGYDVADPRDVEPSYGDLAEFDALLAEAHRLGLKVVVDIVPNHSSDQRQWFRDAVTAGKGSPERARYLFRDGEAPPNNWTSVFGGGAWERVADGQWYLHLFAPEQPDYDWSHPEVGADHEQTLRFWLDRGVDGFRIDVAHGLFKDPALPDQPGGAADLMADPAGVDHMWDQDPVHDVYRRWHEVLSSYDDERMMVGEVWLGDPLRLRRYVREGELQTAFNFRLLSAAWDAKEMRTAIDASLLAVEGTPAPATWVLANHDVVREVTRFGGGEAGHRRARAAMLLLLALPGPAYLYQGEELGLEEIEVPPAARQDPVWERSRHTQVGRDGCRVPIPWSGTEAPYGFSADGVTTWLPQPADWGSVTVQAQTGDPGSFLEFTRAALGLRRAHAALGDGELRWVEAPEGVLAFERPGRPGLQCWVNYGDEAVQLPATPLLASGRGSGAELAPDTAAWVETD